MYAIRSYYATPIYAPGQKLVGALNILSYITPQNRQTLGLTSSIAMAIEKQLALARTVQTLKETNSQLKSVMEYLPQGVISLNSNGEIERYNRRVVEMLSIPVKDNSGSRITSYNVCYTKLLRVVTIQLRPPCR